MDRLKFILAFLTAIYSALHLYNLAAVSAGVYVAIVLSTIALLSAVIAGFYLNKMQ